jgi:hypothetical protein
MTCVKWHSSVVVHFPVRDIFFLATTGKIEGVITVAGEIRI